MVMHVKWQDVGCGINVELGVCEQVIRGGTTAVTHSGGGAIREEEVRSLCMQTNNPKHTHGTCLNLHVLSLKQSQIYTEIAHTSQVGSNRTRI